ncbi:MAG: glycosyltransferase [Pseudomonas helleri]|uniref:glycosyltransferase n=1 Tax=Pseudomonas helleri TaxID=1608996 RepID=UPI003F98FBF7
MKILHIISSTNPTGGGPIEGIKQRYNSMKELGVVVEIACCDAPESPWLTSGNLPKVYALGPSKLGYAYTPNLLPWLRENASKFDAIIINGIWQYHSFAARRALIGTNTPYFVFTHGMLDPWFKRTFPLKHLKKWLYWPWGEYLVLRDAKAVIFTSEEERTLARQSFWLYRANEVVTAYGTSSPPDEELLLSEKFLSDYPSLKGKRIVLFLSRIHEKKGCDLLIKAFAKVAKQDESLHLVMAGPDQAGWTSELKELSLQLGITERITWPGMLQGETKWGAYYASEVFCLPSHQENFGIVVAEALACGKPVLISDKVNIWREIEEDEAGFIGADNLEGTIQNLQRWLDLTHPAYLQMSERAKASFSQRFHTQRAAKRIVEIIKEYRR